MGIFFGGVGGGLERETKEIFMVPIPAPKEC